MSGITSPAHSRNSEVPVSPGSQSLNQLSAIMDKSIDRYPYCIVWTPIPLLTWIFPFLGHMGIAMSNGIIRDFAGPYFVSEDNMAFGHPTKYWQLSPLQAVGERAGWDASVYEASEIYKSRMHNICCDNCHSHVARALNIMRYENRSSWNMVRLAFLMLLHGKYVDFRGFIKTWLPFVIVVSIITTLSCMI